MTKKRQNTPVPPINLDLRTHEATPPLPPEAQRFDLFLIDTGWNEPVSKLVRSHLPLVWEYQRQDKLYILTPEQSVEILRKEPRLIGHDPTVLVYDLLTFDHAHRRNYRGFRLNLGRFRSPQQALSRLQEFIRFLIMHRTATTLDDEVRRELHREGLQGMVKLLREASAELL